MKLINTVFSTIFLSKLSKSSDLVANICRSDYFSQQCRDKRDDCSFNTAVNKFCWEDRTWECPDSSKVNWVLYNCCGACCAISKIRDFWKENEILNNGDGNGKVDVSNAGKKHVTKQEPGTILLDSGDSIEIEKVADKIIKTANKKSNKNNLKQKTSATKNVPKRKIISKVKSGKSKVDTNNFFSKNEQKITPSNTPHKNQNSSSQNTSKIIIKNTTKNTFKGPLQNTPKNITKKQPLSTTLKPPAAPINKSKPSIHKISSFSDLETQFKSLTKRIDDLRYKLNAYLTVRKLVLSEPQAPESLKVMFRPNKLVGRMITAIEVRADSKNKYKLVHFDLPEISASDRTTILKLQDNVFYYVDLYDKTQHIHARFDRRK